MRLTLDVEVSRFAAELQRRGISPHTRVHVLVDVPDADGLPMASIAQAGLAFDFLAEEPDLYSKKDLIDRTR